MDDKAQIEKLTKRMHKDDKAFANLYRIYFDKICKHLLPKVSYDSALAEDLTASTFEKAFLNKGRFRWQGTSFSSWIYKIANNSVIDYYRKASTKLVSSSDPQYIADQSQNMVEDLLVEKDFNNYVNQSLKYLDPREREIVNLKFYEGFTNKVIAKELKISESNVGTILYRSMKKLREKLSDQ